MTASIPFLPIVAFVSLMAMGVGRAAALHRRGITVVLRDRARPWRAASRGALVAGCLLLWAHELLAGLSVGTTSLAPTSLNALLLPGGWTRVVGGVLLVASVVLYALALWAFGESWRIGLDAEAHGALATRGVFAAMRNPIYVAIDLHVGGAFVWSGRLFFLLAALFTCGALHLAARVEETFLEDTYGDAYRAYRARVGRYSPWF